jgi:hypothetical protein
MCLVLQILLSFLFFWYVLLLPLFTNTLKSVNYVILEDFVFIFGIYSTPTIHSTLLAFYTENSYMICRRENCENRNDLDLVKVFLKKWWVESDFKAPSFPFHYGSKFPAVTITVFITIQLKLIFRYQDFVEIYSVSAEKIINDGFSYSYNV